MKTPLAPVNPKDRFDVYRFFNGLSAVGKQGLNLGRTRVPLVKTFLLEHAAQCDGRQPKTPAAIFKGMGAEVKPLDESFMSISFSESDPGESRPQSRTTGYLERYDERFFAYYTCEDADDAQKRVAAWIQKPDLDATWFSSPLLQALWSKDVSKRGDNRFGKLVFRHESIFEMPEDFSTSSEHEDDEDVYESVDVENRKEEDHFAPERRRARFEMGDRIGRIKSSLQSLQNDYAPLHALSSLRLPSRSVAGSHDLYQSGRVTNRSGNFEDHRNTVRYLYRIYKNILETTEKTAWNDTSRFPAKGPRIGARGAPLIVRFGEPLSESTFKRWVSLAFNKRNRFKLWGDPIWLGPTKVHVYGADRHLWQPINLEMTAQGLVAILPKGTCGNTFHRLVTNIQHYVSPRIQAWLGSRSFESVVSQWPANAEIKDDK